MKKSDMQGILAVLISKGRTDLAFAMAGEITAGCFGLRKQVFEYFANPKADLNDKAIHAFAEGKGIDHSKFEEEIYATLHDFLGQGKYQKEGVNKIKVDPEEIRKGIEVEMEHTSCPMIALRISLDHETETAPWKYTRYYAWLDAMEKLMKSGIPPEVVLDRFVAKKVEGRSPLSDLKPPLRKINEQQRQTSRDREKKRYHLTPPYKKEEKAKERKLREQSITNV